MPTPKPGWASRASRADEVGGLSKAGGLCCGAGPAATSTVKNSTQRRVWRPGMSETFDFVVVGGGSAGAAIAARLSEDPSCSVALI